MEEELLLDKNQVIESFGNLPDKVSADELIERILFIRLINERLLEAKTTPGTSHEQFMEEFKAFKAEKKAERQNRP
ncbi:MULTISPECIES: hypothetical protein [Spirosoma]|uniref:hypothetical protein n=1 Tax=Spirosoma TaxID=107 RepID=UPI000965D3A1|nr:MULTISPECIES: hypothetical protein [Spirosoma]MBN8826987.1 hypothetical protein [Spirosoma sp.]OJW75127.1 MAG: hypothetical protein BGO59_17660 [Spirosoma sp. 48-14]